MESKKLLESYLKGGEFTPDMLDSLSLQFKSKIMGLISDEFIQNYVKSKMTQERILKTLEKKILTEYNTIQIPYYEILQNINLCIEVESSTDIVDSENVKKFGETKFSEILIQKNSHKNQNINRFKISEKIFLEILMEFIKPYTENIVLTEDSIKLEFE